MLKSFACFGFCKAHAAAFALPTYHSAWLKTHHPAAFLAGVLTHDPGMYPKRLLLDDARSFGIPVLGLDVNASGDTYRIERVDAPDAVPPTPRRADDAAQLPDAPDPDAGCRPGDARASPTASGSRWPTSRGSARPRCPDRRRPALRRPRRLLDPRPGEPPGHRAARARRGVRLACTAWAAAGPRARRGPGHPARPAAARRRARPVGARGRGGAAQQPAARHPEHRAAARGGAGSGSTSASGRRRSRRRPARSCRPPRSRPSSPSTSATARGSAAGAGLPEMTGPERVRAELDVLGLDVVRARRRVLRPAAARRSGSPAAATCSPPAAAARCGWPGSRSPPRPRRSARGAGSSSSPSTTPPARPTAPSSRTSKAPTPGSVFHSWLLLVRGVLRRTGDRGVSIRATGAWELSAPVGRLAARRPGRAPGPRSRRGRRMPWPAPRRPSAAAREQRRPHRPPGARARLGVQAVALRRHQACRGRPALGSRAPRGSRGAPRNRPPRCPRASCGTPAPAAPDTRVGARAATDPADRRHRTSTEGDPPWPTSVADAPPRRAPSPGCAPQPSRRRSTPSRPARSAELGRAAARRSTSAVAPAAPPSRSPRPATTSPSSTPAPTPWRRCRAGPPRPGASERIHRRAGRHRHRRRARRRRRAPATTSSACHGTLEVVDDPDAALANVAGRPRPRRHALARRRAAPRPPSWPAPWPASSPRPSAILERPDGRWGDDDPAPRRFDEAGVRALLDRPRPHHVREPRRAHLQRPRPRRPWSTPRPTGPRCSSSRRSRAATPTTRCSGHLGQRPARPRDAGTDLPPGSTDEPSPVRPPRPATPASRPTTPAARCCTSTWTPSTPRRPCCSHPELVGTPVIIGGGNRGVVLSATYEARALRRDLGDADGPRPPAVPAGHRPAARPRALQRDLAGRHGDLPLGDAGRRAALARRGVPRRLRRACAGWAAPPRSASTIRDTVARRAGHHLLGRRRPDQVRRQARLGPGQARRACSSCPRDEVVAVPPPAAGRGAVGRRGAHRGGPACGWACAPSPTSPTPRWTTLRARPSATPPASTCTSWPGDATRGRSSASSARRASAATRPSTTTSTTPAEIHRRLLALSERTAARMRAAGLTGRTVTLGCGSATSRRSPARAPCASRPTAAAAIHEAAVGLFDALGLQRARIRLVGVRLEKLVEASPGAHPGGHRRARARLARRRPGGRPGPLAVRCRGRFDRPV